MFGQALPSATTSLNLVPIDQPPPLMPISSSYPSVSVGADYTPGSVSTIPKGAATALTIAAAAAPIVQSYVQMFRRPDGSVVATQAPAQQSTGAAALQASGDKTQISIKNEYLLIGGIVLLVFMLGKHKR
jgi:hypothetical protein